MPTAFNDIKFSIRIKVIYMQYSDEIATLVSRQHNFKTVDEYFSSSVFTVQVINLAYFIDILLLYEIEIKFACNNISSFKLF